MKKLVQFIILLIIINFFENKSYASFCSSGQITYRYLTGLTYEITVKIYSFTTSLVDRPQLNINLGDGTQDIFLRIQKINLPNNISENTYIKNHTYNTPAIYVISLEDPNRNGGIVNIPNSINIPFYIESMINVFDPTINCIVNSADFCSSTPVIKEINDNHFKFNLTAFDPDNDSLSYELVPCKGNSGLDIPGYTFPTGVTLNSYNGEFRWDDSTASQGEYCFAAKIYKWRNGRNVSYVDKDFMITVASLGGISYTFSGTNSLLTDINGNYYTTINPNDTLNLNITYTDTNTAHPTSILSFSDIFTLNNPAIYSSASSMNISNGYFKWIPQMINGRKRPYLLTFRGNSIYPLYANYVIPHDLSLFIYVTGNNDTICPPFPIGYSINEINNYSNYFKIYPNPTTDNLTIETPPHSTIEILNIEGQPIKTLATSGTKTNVDVSALPCGVYIVQVKTEKGVGVRKFIKE